MAKTQVRSQQLEDEGVKRDDLNSTTSGQAVVKKLVEGTGVQLTSTGADAGTGDVTVATRAADASNAGHVSTGTQTLAGSKTFQGPNTRLDGQYGQDAEYDAGNSGTSKTIDFNNGNVQKVSMTGSCTFTFSNGIACTRYMLKLVQGSGGNTYAWPVAVNWGSRGAPDASGAGKVDLIMFYFDGSTYFGSYLLNY